MEIERSIELINLNYTTSRNNYTFNKYLLQAVSLKNLYNGSLTLQNAMLIGQRVYLGANFFAGLQDYFSMNILDAISDSIFPFKTTDILPDGLKKH